jgi:single-stranded-DNA-specific exonuclease
MNGDRIVDTSRIMPTTLSKRWIIAPQVPTEILRQYRGMGPVLAQILRNRGFNDPEAAYRFLCVKEDAGDPFKMKGMSQAVHRIRQAIRNREPIVVYGDFDADGVTSTVLLVQTLKSLNANVEAYIPHRVDEGYGLNSKALQQLARKGKKLVITVDCGIRSIDEVEDGKAAGLDMIVTDHHSIGPEIPRALAVLNPKQEDCKYPEDMLAGVGVAYKLAVALLKAANGNDRRASRPQLSPDDLLDLVAIGTVADLAPLDRMENRALVRRGLQTLNLTNRMGLQALLEVAGLQPGELSAMSIGFGIGPRINAAGRLDSAMTAYNLLCCQSRDEAVEMADKLQALNTKRQDLTRAAQELIKNRLEETDQSDMPLIFAADPGFQPGIVGLVAGRLVEEYYRPAIVMEMGDEESHASCRSIPQFDITQALDQCSDLLVRHGGHAQAAGLTIRNENIPAFHARMMEIAYESLEGQELLPTLDIDAEVDLRQVNEHLIVELEQLEPTGHSNTAPVLMTSNVRVVESRTVGKESQHLKLRITRPGCPYVDAIGFGLGHWYNRVPDYIDVAYQLEMNEWNGRRSVQMNLQDIRPAMHSA